MMIDKAKIQEHKLDICEDCTLTMSIAKHSIHSTAHHRKGWQVGLTGFDMLMVCDGHGRAMMPPVIAGAHTKSVLPW